MSFAVAHAPVELGFPVFSQTRTVFVAGLLEGLFQGGLKSFSGDFFWRLSSRPCHVGPAGRCFQERLQIYQLALGEPLMF